MDRVLADMRMIGKENGADEETVDIMAYNIILLLSHHRLAWFTNDDIWRDDRLESLFDFVKEEYGIYPFADKLYCLETSTDDMKPTRKDYYQGNFILDRYLARVLGFAYTGFNYDGGENEVITVAYRIGRVPVYSYNIPVESITDDIRRIVKNQREDIERIFAKIGVEVVSEFLHYGPGIPYEIVDEI